MAHSLNFLYLQTKHPIMTAFKNCLQCGQALHGRPDKKFCDDHCRSHFNNVRNSDITSTMRSINYLLRKNRRILAECTSMNSPVIIEADLLRQFGFDFRYHTHSFINQQGKQYITCYDYAYCWIDQHRVTVCMLKTLKDQKLSVQHNECSKKTSAVMTKSD
jgi:predicted nucleic acid-binding Zn ribbon protein